MKRIGKMWHGRQDTEVSMRKAMSWEAILKKMKTEPVRGSYVRPFTITDMRGNIIREVRAHYTKRVRITVGGERVKVHRFYRVLCCSRSWCGTTFIIPESR